MISIGKNYNLGMQIASFKEKAPKPYGNDTVISLIYGHHLMRGGGAPKYDND